jgi:hypothetical protein
MNLLDGKFEIVVSRRVEATLHSLPQRDSFLQRVVPFIACGDLTGYVPPDMDFDADKSYHIDEKNPQLQPLAPPIRPPYEESLKRAKEEAQSHQFKK